MPDAGFMRKQNKERCLNWGGEIGPICAQNKFFKVVNQLRRRGWKRCEKACFDMDGDKVVGRVMRRGREEERKGRSILLLSREDRKWLVISFIDR